MPTLYTNKAALQLPVEAADTWTRAPGVEASGNILYMEAIYTLTTGTDEAAADVIRIAKLPANARLIPELCKIVRPNLGTSFFIVSIGDSPVVANAFTASAARYSTTVNITSAGTSDFAYSAQPAGLLGYTLPADAWITATLGTVTAPIAGQVVKFVLAYAAAV